MKQNKSGRPMSLVESAMRMTALLARKPRHGKTRAYLASFPKRRRLIVSPDEYGIAAPAVIAFDAEPIMRKMPGEQAVRKDRMRPRAKIMAQEPPLPVHVAPATGPWHCRPTGRHHQSWISKAPRLFRTIEQTSWQRLVLYAAQEGICALCGGAMEGTAFSLGLDHCVPRSLDGTDGFGNLVLCHGECNGRKTNDIPTGCEMVWLFAINARLAVTPDRF